MTATVLLFTVGCQSFTDLAVNPNAPVTAPASLVFDQMCLDIYSPNTGSATPWNSASQYAQYWCINYNYYGNQDYGWTTTSLDFTSLNNVLKMEQEATRNGAGAINP